MKMCRMHLNQFTSHDFQGLGIIFFSSFICLFFILWMSGMDE